MAKLEYCAGIIPLKKSSDGFKVLLAKHVKGNYWSFPKGHIDDGEDDFSAACRELFEETNLEVSEPLNYECSENFKFKRDHQEIHKFCTYFSALVKGELKNKEPLEVLELKWFFLDEAIEIITFQGAREMAQSIFEKLK